MANLGFDNKFTGKVTNTSMSLQICILIPIQSRKA